MQEAMQACIPVVAETDWWALISIDCGIFVLGMTLGALLGVAIAHEAGKIAIEEQYDPRMPG